MLFNFTLRQLAYFVAAAESGSTAKAAEKLHLSQSALSSSLTDLESAAGTTLLVRRQGKGLSLTTTGEELLAYAHRILHASADFDQHSRFLRGDHSGSLNLGCVETIAPAYMPRLMSAFRKQFPEVEMHIMESSQQKVLAAVDEGRVDIAITLDHGIPHTFSTVFIARPKLNIMVSRDHPLATATEVTLHDVKDESLVLLGTTPLKQMAEKLFSDASISPRIVHTSSNFDHVRALVHENLGYTLVGPPDGRLPHWGDGVVVIPIKGRPGTQTIVATFDRRIPPNRRMRNFLELAGTFTELNQEAEN
ncbi:MAG: LysR family transcriptional regulator [Corynebacterium sp.]|nr:LysR family transcriptional regulator [Corynebacterium sp.]